MIINSRRREPAAWDNIKSISFLVLLFTLFMLLTLSQIFTPSQMLAKQHKRRCEKSESRTKKILFHCAPIIRKQNNGLGIQFKRLLKREEKEVKK